MAKGLHGDATAGWLMKELQSLQRRAYQVVFNPEANRSQAIPNETLGLGPTPELELRAAARAIALRRKAGRLDAGRVRMDERRAAQAAMVAAAQGNFAQAFNFKKQQLLNFFLHRELEEAVKDRDALLDFAAQYSKDKSRARLGKAGPIYRDGVELLLTSFKLKMRSDPDEVLPSLNEVVDALSQDAVTVGFDVEPLAKQAAKGTPWKELSVAEMRNLLDALNNIRKAALRKSEVRRNGKLVDRDALVAEMVADAESAIWRVQSIPSSESAASLWEKVTGFVAGVDGSSLRPTVMLEWLAGWRKESAWYEAIVLPLREAKQRKEDILREHMLPIIQAFENIPAAVRARFQDNINGAQLFPSHRTDVPAPTKRFELVMMALHTGTASSLHRLLEGRRITQAQLDAALSQLTVEEWDWVQSVWNAHEGLWPLIAELEERDSGLRPRKLQRLSSLRKGKTYAGGYFAAVYDRRVEAVGERQEAQVLADLMDPSYSRPGTSHSHTKARAGDFSGALSLEPSVIQTSFLRVAHDLAFREVLKDVGGLMLDERIQTVLKERLGQGRAEQFLAWLKDVGQMASLDGATRAGALTRLLRWLKMNTVTGVLGYSVKTAAGDLANLSVALRDSPLKHRFLADAMRHLLVTRGSLDAARAKSGELRFRAATVKQQFEEQVRSLTATGLYSWKAMAEFRKNAFIFMEATDTYTSTAIWLGAYRQALAEGKSEREAVETGDHLIQSIFPSNSPVDLSGIMRDKGAVGQLLMLHGYLNVSYNRFRNVLHQYYVAEDLGDAVRATPAVAWRMLGLVVSMGLLSEYLSGRGKEKDEDWATYLLRKMVGVVVSSVPFGGDVWAHVEARALGRTPRDTVSYAGGLVRAIETIADDDADGEKKVKALLNSTMPFTGLPTAAPVRAGDYLYRVSTGEQDVEGPLDFMGGVIYGKRPDQPANPLQDLSDIFEK